MSVFPGGSYPVEPLGPAHMAHSTFSTVRENMESLEAHYEKKLAEVRRIRELLEKHPEVEELMTLVRGVGL